MTRLGGLLRRLSLRWRITLLAVVLFSVAVSTGALILIELLKYSLTRELDNSARKAGQDVAALVSTGRLPQTVVASSAAVVEVQVVDSNDAVVAASPGGDATKSILLPDELGTARTGRSVTVPGARLGIEDTLRVTATRAGDSTVLVATSLERVRSSTRVLASAALAGGPVAVLAMAVLTWVVVGLALRPVAALRHGAQEITATGLTDQRLPVPAVQDEIHRLAVTLNAMLDRIDHAATRQRSFVGDAAHELRSPIASLRVQLEVAARLGERGADVGWIDDVLVDVDRLDRLVEDLLVLARADEAGLRRHVPVDLAPLAAGVVSGYRTARVPVTVSTSPASVTGDPEALRRVLVNLVDNAVRHASTEVSVCVEAGRLEVVDDGPGISAADRERVFDRFFRGDASRSRESGGTGLGLAIVRDLVRAHGGIVTLGDRGDGRPGLAAVVRLPSAPRVPA